MDRELMLRVAEARVVIEDYRRYDNEGRPHGGIGDRTPAQAGREAQALAANPASVLHGYLYDLTQPLTRSGPNAGTRPHALHQLHHEDVELFALLILNIARELTRRLQFMDTLLLESIHAHDSSVTTVKLTGP